MLYVVELVWHFSDYIACFFSYFLFISFLSFFSFKKKTLLLLVTVFPIRL